MNIDKIGARNDLKKRPLAARAKSCLCLVLPLALASCVPLDSRYDGSYGGYSEDENRAEATCRDYARGQRLDVQRVLSSRSTGSGNDYEVQLRVQRSGRTEDVTCFTDIRTGSTRLAEGSSYGGSGADESLRDRAEATCRDYARGQRLDVQRVLSSRSLGSGNDYEVQLRIQRSGRTEDVTCSTDVRTGATRIAEGSLSGSSSGGSREDEQLRNRAEATCRDYARGQRLDVQRVLSSRSLGSGNDYEVQLRVGRSGRTEDVTCFTDVRSGSTRIGN